MDGERDGTGEGDGASDDAAEVDGLLGPFEPAGKPRRWFRRVDGLNRIDLDDLDLFRNVAVKHQLLSLVLLLSLKDRASVVDLVPGPFTERQGEAFVGQVGLMMFYVVNGEHLELVPPPPGYKNLITRAVLSAAGLSGWRRRVADAFRRVADLVDGQTPMPRQGRFRLKCGEFEVGVEALEYRTEHGPRLILNLDPQPDALSDRAQAVMKALFAARRAQAS